MLTILTMCIISTAATAEPGLSAVADGPGVTVRPPSGGRITAAAGSFVQRAITVENNTETTKAVTLYIQVPRGVRMLQPSLQLTLQSGEWNIFPLALQIEGNASPEEVVIPYAVYSSGGDGLKSLAGEGTLYIDVQPNPELRVEITRAPALVTAESSFDFDIIVTNLGNVSLDVELAYQSTGRSALLDEESLTGPMWLAPGESKITTLTFLVPSKLSRSLVDRIEITVKDHTWGVSDIDTASIELVPVSLSRDRAFLYFPLQISTAAESQVEDARRRNTGTVSVAGNSSFGKAGENKVELELTKTMADVAAPGDAGPSDRFFLGYSDPMFDVEIGDKTRSVSSLIQSQEETRGALVQMTAGHIQTGVVLQQADRPTADDPAQKENLATVYAGVSTGEAGDRSPRYTARLSTTGQSRQAVSGPVDQVSMSLEQRYNGINGVTAEVEIASMLSSGGLASSDSAAGRLAVGYSGDLLDLSFSGNAVGTAFAGPLAPGYSIFAAGTFSPGVLGLEVDGAMRISQMVAAGSAVDENAAAANNTLQEEIATGITLRGDIGKFRLAVTDYRSAESYNRTQETRNQRLQTNFSFTKDLLTVKSSGEFSMRTGSVANIPLYGLQLLLNPVLRFDKAEVGLYSGYRIPNLSLPKASSMLDLALKFATFGHRFQFEGKLEATLPVAEPADYTLRGSAHAALLLGNSSLISASLAAVYPPAGNSGRSFLEGIEIGVAFSTGLDVPYARNPQMGAVKGTLLDSVTNQPVPRVIIRLGEQASITDADGAYTFPAVAVGTYRLIPEPSSLPSGRLVRQESTRVTVRPRSTTLSQLELFAGREITGKVVSISPTAAAILKNISRLDWREEVEAGLARSVPVVNTGVRISNGDLSFATQTDQHGMFSFAALEPAVWHLSVSQTETDGRLFVKLSDGGNETLAAESKDNPGTYIVDLTKGGDVSVSIAQIKERSSPKVLQGMSLTLR